MLDRREALKKLRFKNQGSILLRTRILRSFLYPTLALYFLTLLVRSCVPASFVKLYVSLKKAFKGLPQQFRYSVINGSFFLKDYYNLNDTLWQDGFLIDFLQKKVVDKWLRGFVIHSGYLFNERWLFDYVVRFYISLIIWPGYRINIYEFNNVASTLLVTLFLAITLFISISFLYLGLLVL